MFPWDYGYKHRYTNEESFLSEITLYSPTIYGKTNYYISIAKKEIKCLLSQAPTMNIVKDVLKKNT
jgi:hypothetical protein